MNDGLRNVGNGIAIAGLCGSAAWLEINGFQSAGIWVLVVLCIFF